MIICLILLTCFTQLFPGIVTAFPDLAKPIELRIDKNYIYITDQQSLFVYDKNNFKMIKKIGQKGEGPQEFQTNLRVNLLKNKIFLNDSYKVVQYSKSFELLQEKRLTYVIDRINPIEDKFVLVVPKEIDNQKYRVYKVLDKNLENAKDILVEPDDQSFYKNLIPDVSKCRTSESNIFIAQSRKGFYIDVFNNQGKKIYVIEKKLKKIKYVERHKKLYEDEILYFVGKNRFDKYKERKLFEKPMDEFVPDFNNFWVIENRIYVKTYDIKDNTEKYIILDLKGNIQKEVFLPITYMEILTFNNNKFYYLTEAEEDENEGWILCAVAL